MNGPSNRGVRGARIPAKGPTFEDDLIEFARRLMRPGSIANGVLLEDIDVATAAETRVLHGLGRTPVGHIIVKRSTQALDVWESSDADKDALYLQAGADVTVSIWVF